jgi:hypothetical protein
MEIRYTKSMPIPLSTPPPFVKVDEYLRDTRLPPWIETTTVEALREGHQRSVERFEEWSKVAAAVLRTLAAVVEKDGACNLSQVIEEIDAGARQLATLAKAEPAGRQGEWSRRRENAFRYVLDAYRETLQSLVAIRDAELVRSTAILSDEVFARIWNEADAAELKL